jgi:hypothetical protein
MLDALTKGSFEMNLRLLSEFNPGAMPPKPWDPN